jgi:hypothetical protein
MAFLPSSIGSKAYFREDHFQGADQSARRQAMLNAALR